MLEPLGVGGNANCGTQELNLNLVVLPRSSVSLRHKAPFEHLAINEVGQP